ncbi:hypothetical protein [Peptoniphilus harei]|uniref:Periplasmic binding protein n=1 Tax=Peptoniphilus harei TaxID=54005 RepID=A0A943XVU3_9FIRM|nr:hypothetical protein [Peptoniphilus harei]MBS6534856.1 hypothetical protein [Peptoniphilus harei]MDU1642110.1 hypothetical protein [Peptoniphilus harei]
MKKKYLIILLTLPLIFSGCKKTNRESANSNQEAPKNSIQSEKVETNDTSIKENKIEEKYNVIALTRNISLILKEIGYENVGGTVEEAKDLYPDAKIVGSEKNPDSDLVFEVYPDLIITDSNNHKDFLSKMDDYNFKKQCRSLTMPISSTKNLEEYIYSLCKDMDYPKYSEENPIPKDLLDKIEKELNQ